MPWAASLVITARLFVLIYDYYYGTLNLVLLSCTSSARRSTSSATTRWTMLSMVARRGLRVAAVHRLRLRRRPQRHPRRRLRGGPHRRRQPVADLLADHAAAAAPGAPGGDACSTSSTSSTRSRSSTPSTTATPGSPHDTTITFMYKLAFKSAEKDVGMSAAAGIFNVAADPRRGGHLPARSSSGGRRTSRWPPSPAAPARVPHGRAAGRRRSAGSGTVAGCMPVAGLFVALVFLCALPRHAARLAAPEQRRRADAADLPAAGLAAVAPTPRCSATSGS